jgi:voltage-gated potassium channel
MGVSKVLAMLGWLLSPTRNIVDCWKRGGRAHRGNTLRRWSLGLFLVETLGSIVLAFLVTQPPPSEFSVSSGALVVYAYSRINEIAFAFYRDPLSPIKSSDLTPRDRLRMVMRSYFGLGFNFALLYYFLPIAALFKEPLASFFEAIYFSGVTLATLGYGDVLPVHWLARLLSLYEVSCSILLIAVAIATYIGRASETDA